MFTPSSHPIATAVAVAHGELSEVAETALFSMADDDLEAQTAALHVLAAKVAALELRLVAESDERGLDTKTTMVRSTRQSPPVAHRRIGLARSLERHEPLRVAMGRGEVTEAQGRVIVEAVEAIPADHEGITPEILARAEELLIAYAAAHHPQELKRLGERILETLAPDVAEAIEGERLQRDHDHAQKTTRLFLCDDGHGKCHLRGHLTSAVGAMLKRNLLALMAPKHVRATCDGNGAGEAVLGRPTPERWGQAFSEYVERYPINRLPDAGGVQARAIITMDVDQLTHSLTASGVATIDGIPIPAGVARRMTCEAGITPVVLNGASVPLDLGRSRRLHSTAQRLAMDLRDGSCTTDGCDWPPYLCHAHHDTPWSHGGSTSLTDGRLLCPHHHRMAHHPTWQMSKTKHGQVLFLRR